MSVEQLIAKALSTTSEDEAIACLRMARKRGGKLESATQKDLVDGKNAEYWHKIAVHWYKKYKEDANNTLDAIHNNTRLRSKIRELEGKLENSKILNYLILPIVFIFVAFIIIK